MKQQDDKRELMRWLHGELSEAEADRLRARLEAEPALARERDRLERVWTSIPDAPAPDLPADFAAQVVASAAGRAQESAFPSWSLAPAAARWAMFPAALGAIALGAALATAPAVQPAAVRPTAAHPAATPESAIPTLADGYWRLLVEGESAPAADEVDG